MSDNHRSIFSGMQVLFEGKFVRKQAVIIENKIITAIIPDEMIPHHLPARRYEFPANHYLVPGFIDLHVHGTSGVDVMDASLEALTTMKTSLATEGVTGFLATTMTATRQQIEAVLALIPAAMQASSGAAILGVHLEGPFIAKEKMGAQNPENIALPNIEEMKHWQRLCDDAIKIVTLAPELPGALDFITALNKMQVIASVGHTNATYEETCKAISAGCSHATHLFNAMRGMQQREPGAVTALLLSDLVTAEIIVDGYHLHPAIAEVALRLKGKERLVLITDAMRAKCMKPGTYDLGGQAVTVQAGKATLSDGTLAGSTLSMPEAIKHMQEATRLSLAETMLLASQNPARVLGLSERKGVIEVGKDADFVILDSTLQVIETWREGTGIYKASLT